MTVLTRKFFSWSRALGFLEHRVQTEIQIPPLSDNTTSMANSPTPISWTHPTPNKDTPTHPKSCSPPAHNIISSLSPPFWPNPSLTIWPLPTLTHVNPSLPFLPGYHGNGTTFNHGTQILMTPPPSPNKRTLLPFQSLFSVRTLVESGCYFST